MLTTLVDKCLLQGGDQSVVTSCQAACSNNVHIVINGHSCDLLRSLEKTTDINVETEISESTSNNLCTSVMAVLAHLGDEDTGITSLILRELLHIVKC